MSSTNRLETTPFTSRREAARWAETAEPGTVIEYHRGRHLAGWPAEDELRSLASLAEPRIALFQKRLGHGFYSYRAMVLTTALSRALWVAGRRAA